MVQRSKGKKNECESNLAARVEREFRVFEAPAVPLDRELHLGFRRRRRSRSADRDQLGAAANVAGILGAPFFLARRRCECGRGLGKRRAGRERVPREKLGAMHFCCCSPLRPIDVDAHKKGSFSLPLPPFTMTVQPSFRVSAGPARLWLPRETSQSPSQRVMSRNCV